MAGVIICWPYHNFQSFIAQGDHGRDLYAAAAVLRGEMPYKDFWWVYGPLMPYYYGLMFKLFGVHIPSILLGQIILNIGAGLGIFLCLARLFSPAAAFLGGLWFLTYRQDFFFTYNHAGGIFFITLIMWAHLAYIQKQQNKHIFLSLLFIFILGLIKINFAITALLAGAVIIFITNRLADHPFGIQEKIAYTLSFIALPLLWFAIYSFFLQGLTIHEIRQCLPYLGGDEPYNSVGPLQTIPQWAAIIVHNIRSSWISLALCALILLSTAQTLILIVKHKNKTLALIIIYAILFYALNMHEFIKSGVFYRLFWTQPLSILLTFTVIAAATQQLNKMIKALLLGALFVIAAFTISQNSALIQSFKNPAHYLGSDRGHVYVSNDRNWMQTVVLSTKTINTALRPNESFLALPYDCLYYYLTDRRSPTRQLIFFDHIKIQPEQEARIIAELENAKTSLVLLSSRQSSHEHGLGTLGVTNCPMMAQYINTNFTPYARIGDWVNEPGWAWNHGTYIFKRKEPSHE